MSNVDVTTWSEEQNQLGEGPLTNHLRSSLVWCDINSCALYEKPFSGGNARRFDLPVMPSAVALVDPSTVLVATEIDFRFIDLDSGTSTVHLAFPEDAEMRANDGRVHPSGAFWIGTMPKDGRSRPGSIWRLLEGELTPMIDEVLIPNSICFAADGQFAYYTDTPQRVIWRIPTDPDSGEISGERSVFAEIGEVPGGPDGSVTDAAGNVWNARWGGSAMDVYDPSGRRIHSYPLPARQPTCPAFVGDALDRIVTTSATAGLADAAPADGTVLEIHVAVEGKAEPIVRP